MQGFFVVLFQPEFAHVLRAPVVGLSGIGPVFHGLLFGWADPPDVAQQMAAHLAKRIVAKQAGFDFHTRKSKTLGHEPGHFFIGESVANGQRGCALHLLLQTFETASVTRLDVYHAGQGLDRRFQITHLRRRDFQGVSRIVGGQHDSISVHDQPAVGDDGHHRDSVGFGLRGQFVVAHHLQPDHAKEQQEKAQQHEPTRRQQPRAKPIQLQFEVFEFGHRGRF